MDFGSLGLLEHGLRILLSSEVLVGLYRGSIGIMENRTETTITV